MKKLIVFLVLSFSALAGNAQLIIDSVGRVGIMTGDLELKSRLTVGNPTYAYNASIGVASSPIVRNKNNIGVVGLHYGGAGVFGANSTYYYNNPINIQEAYAGYFVGPVNVTSNMTATSLFTTTADASLSENIVPLSERDRSGRETLENI